MDPSYYKTRQESVLIGHSHEPNSTELLERRIIRNSLPLSIKY